MTIYMSAFGITYTSLTCCSIHICIVAVPILFNEAIIVDLVTSSPSTVCWSWASRPVVAPLPFRLRISSRRYYLSSYPSAVVLLSCFLYCVVVFRRRLTSYSCIIEIVLWILNLQVLIGSLNMYLLDLFWHIDGMIFFSY